MLRRKFNLISSLVVATPLVLSTGIYSTVHASSLINGTSVTNKTESIKLTSTKLSYVNSGSISKSGYSSNYYSLKDLKAQLDSLVTNRTITESQESIISNLLNDKNLTPENFKTQLNALVAKGTITSYSETLILNLFNIKIVEPIPVVSNPTPTVSNPVTPVVSKPSFGNYSFDSFKSKLDSLLTNGTITESQESVILNLLSNGKLTPENFSSQLDILITEGAITDYQKILILNSFNINAVNPIPAVSNPVIVIVNPTPAVSNPVTPVVSKPSFGNYSFDSFKSKLDSLLTNGTITKSQESVILNLLSNGKLTPENFSSQLDILITEGAITSYQKILILNLFNINIVNPTPAVSNPVTPVVFKPSFGNYSFDSFKSKLDSLLTNGTITESQESVILNLLSNGKLTPENFSSQLDILITEGAITSYQKILILNLFNINIVNPIPFKPIPVSQNRPQSNKIEHDNFTHGLDNSKNYNPLPDKSLNNEKQYKNIKAH
jgi:hypothetical protein